MTEETQGKTEALTISAPNLQVAQWKIRGASPYVQNKFSRKAREEMVAKQKAGSTASKGKKREAKDFEECYEQALHVSEEGWYGIPAPAFRNACVSACRMAGFKMTHAKLSLFIVADGLDVDDATPLVRIAKGEPEYFETTVRNDSGVCDVRARPKWAPGWEATVTARFDADQFTITDVTNLLMRAGLQVGIGEGRPDSKKSCGQGWGLFELCDD
jgi:hypothetical protein